MNMYLFHGRNYVGYFEVLAPMDLVFHVGNELDMASQYLMLYTNNFSTKESINIWLEERVMPDGRPEKSRLLLEIGAKSNSTWDILMATHCISGQDDFWWDNRKSLDWYIENIEGILDKWFKY